MYTFLFIIFCRLFYGLAKIGFLNEYLYLCIIGNLLIKQKMRRLIILVMALLLVGLTGCGKIKEIKVTKKANEILDRVLDKALGF